MSHWIRLSIFCVILTISTHRENKKPTRHCMNVKLWYIMMSHHVYPIQSSFPPIYPKHDDQYNHNRLLCNIDATVCAGAQCGQKSKWRRLSYFRRKRIMWCRWCEQVTVVCYLRGLVYTIYERIFWLQYHMFTEQQFPGLNIIQVSTLTLSSLQKLGDG